MAQDGFVQSTAAADQTTRLSAERVRFMYRMSGFATVAATAVAALVGGYFWTAHNSTIALGLAIYFVLIAVGRALVYLQYRKGGIDENPDPWILAATVTMALSGLGWGAMAWFLFSVALPDSALIVSVVSASMVMSGLLLLAPFSRLMVAFSLPAAAPLLIKLATSGDTAHWVTAIAYVVVLGAVYLAALRLQTGLSQSLRHALDNKRLAKVMAQSKNELENLNEELSSNIDRRARIEEELRQAKRAAEAAVMAKDEFLATMSHEIRTPLNGILPILDILRSTELNDTQKDYLNTAFQSSKHLLSIIDDILDYSKIEAGKLELETVGLNLRELLDSVVRLMSSSARKKGLDLNVRVEPGVRIALRGDPVRMRQILTNLVSNAIKFTDQGSVEVTVSNRSETRDQTELLFAVKDTGIGMDKATADRLFKPFSQADASTTRTYGGSGLGLAICKRLVELMGGRIGVKSEPGSGSVFWFSIHLKKSLGDIQADRKNLQDARILLGCGDEGLRQRLGVFFEGWGSGTASAANLRQVAAKIKDSLTLGGTWAFDVMVLDTPSLGAQAPELIRRIRRDARFNSMSILVLNRDGMLPEPLAGFKDIDAVDRNSAQGQFHEAIESLLHGGEELERPPKLGSDVLDYGVDDTLEEEEAAPQASAAPETAAEDSGASRVLLVEDNPVNLHVAQKLLALIGVDHDVAKNGKEAIRQLHENSYNAVLMDCMMPVMDGYSATQEWRRIESEKGSERVPILAMTANAMAGDRQKCLDAGMDDYMAKPLNKQLLEQMLKRWLSAAPAPQLDVMDEPPAAARAAAETQELPPEVAVLRPRTRSAGKSVLDRQVLDDLIDIMGDEYVDLIEVYLEDTPNCIGLMNEAAGDDDIDGLIAPAHSLKSTSANLGAMGLSEMAKAIEFGAREGNLSDVAQKIAAIESEFEQVASELQQIKTAS